MLWQKVTILTRTVDRKIKKNPVEWSLVNNFFISGITHLRLRHFRA